MVCMCVCVYENAGTREIRKNWKLYRDSVDATASNSEFWSSLPQTTTDNSAKDGERFSTEERSEERHETLKFAFPKKVKAHGRRKANASKRKVTFADH